jgi:hypothetical protein
MGMRSDPAGVAGDAAGCPMSSTGRVLRAFIDAWNAGRRPRVREYLEQVPAGPDREELAGRLTAWLALAPAPDLTDDARAAIRAERVVRHVIRAVGADERA